MIHNLRIRSMIAALVMITSIVLAVVVGVNATGTASQSPVDFPPTGIPACEYEDASTQDVCFWDSETVGDRAIRGDAIVFNHGTVAYYPETGEIAVWSDDRNDVIIHKIR